MKPLSYLETSSANTQWFCDIYHKLEDFESNLCAKCRRAAC